MASVGCGAGLGASSVYNLSFADLLLATVIVSCRAKDDGDGVPPWPDRRLFMSAFRLEPADNREAGEPGSRWSPSSTLCANLSRFGRIVRLYAAVRFFRFDPYYATVASSVNRTI